MHIYLDYNATTPLEGDALAAMTAALAGQFGNASSVHYFGQQAKALLDEARTHVAALIGASPADLVLTAGGTEADNLALRGLAEHGPASPRHRFVISAIEHEAVTNTARALGARGWQTTVVPVEASGLVPVDAMAAALDDSVTAVAIMLANNEIGTIQPVAEVAALARERGALVLCDAVQAVGKIPVDVQALGVDLLALSAHKFGGPKGVGALWIRKGTRLKSLLTGGRQERGRRAGTENVPGVVGMGAAARVAGAQLERRLGAIGALRDRLERGILDGIAGTSVNGDRDRRVPNTTNISFEGAEGESLVMALDLEGIAVSTGAACSSGTLEPSHVLRALGLPPSRVQSAIRFSLGAATAGGDIDRVLAVLPGIVARARALGGRR